MVSCLIIDNMHESLLQRLEKAGIRVDYKPDIERKQILISLSDYEILVIRNKTLIDRELIDKGSKLKIVARAGAGIDNLDYEYLKSRGITVFNAPEGNRDAVGDHTVGMLLVLLNKIHVADWKIRKSIWDREGARGTELHNKTVGIIGYGNMGKAFAKRLVGFGCKVLAYDKYKNNYGDENAKAVSLEEIYGETDILSLHVPLTKETHGLVDEDYLNRFSKRIYLINMARGEVAPMKSIVYGLERDLIIAAALDVLECEELVKMSPEQKKYFKVLTASDRTLFTPHVGGWSFESFKKISEVLADKIINELR